MRAGEGGKGEGGQRKKVGLQVQKDLWSACWRGCSYAWLFFLSKLERIGQVWWWWWCVCTCVLSPCVCSFVSMRFEQL